MTGIYSSDNDIDPSLLKSKGNWYIIKSARYSDLDLVDAETGAVAAKALQRTGDVRVWWDNGPQLYAVTYAHSITAMSASTNFFSIKVEWRNQGGGLEKSETVTDRVSCRDQLRRQFWTFGTTSEIADAIARATAEPFGPASWTACA